MTDNIWTEDYIKDLTNEILKKSRQNLPENQKNIFTMLTVQICIQSKKYNNKKNTSLEAHFNLDGIPLITTKTWYEDGWYEKGNCSTVKERLISNLSLGILNWDRVTDNALTIETNLYNYLQKWLSPYQILNIMTDTTQGIRVQKNRFGTQKRKIDPSARTVKIYKANAPEKTVENIEISVSKGCLFGRWRITTQAKWSDHGVVFQGIIPEVIKKSMSTIATLTDHPSLCQNAKITKIKQASKTTRFSAEIDVITRASVIKNLSRKNLKILNGPYEYQIIK